MLDVEAGEHEISAVCLHGRAHQVEQLPERRLAARSLFVVDLGHCLNVFSHAVASCRDKCRKPYHANVQLVVLAAGHGRRFGGLKQLAPVGPAGEAIMDYTARDALSAGFDEVVLIVREEVRSELLDHIGKYWPAEMKVTPVVQGPVAGTAQAVASAAEAVTAPFGVANADDLYGPAAFAHLGSETELLKPGEHAIIGYRLADTVLTDDPVTRGVCETTDSGALVRVVEQSVVRSGDGFTGRPLGSGPDGPATALSGDEIVSMNLWGFSPLIFEGLEDALGAFDPKTAPHQPGKPPELLLPSVVAELVGAGKAAVRVRRTEGRCIGITHPDDLPAVQEIVAAERHSGGS